MLAACAQQQQQQQQHCRHPWLATSHVRWFPHVFTGLQTGLRHHLDAKPYRSQVHDFWHVLFGCHTNGFGEVALKAVEFVQVGGTCLFSVGAGLAGWGANSTAQPVGRQSTREAHRPGLGSLPFMPQLTKSTVVPSLRPRRRGCP